MKYLPLATDDSGDLLMPVAPTKPQTFVTTHSIPSIFCRHFYVSDLQKKWGMSMNPENNHERKADKIIARRKYLCREAYENKPVELDDFDDLIGAMDRIREAKGRVVINKLNLRSDAVSDILTMCFYELVKGAPGLTGSRKVKQNANDFAASMSPIISTIRQNPNVKTYQHVADELTEMKIETFQTKKGTAEAKWYPKTVQNLEKRINTLRQAGKIAYNPT